MPRKTPKRTNVSISTASTITGIEVHTLRYWEREFGDFLNPERTDGGQRRYGSQDIQTLFLIKRLLKDEMYSIAGARKHLSNLPQFQLTQPGGGDQPGTPVPM